MKLCFNLIIDLNIKEIDINARNWVNSAQDRDYLECPCECGTEPPGSINHIVS